MFSRIMEEGFRKVWGEDRESQVNFLTTIAKDVRNMDVNILINAGGIFIPNNEYMIHFFGAKILEPRYDCYSNFGNCHWNNNIIFPVRDILDRIVAISGFNPINKLMSQQEKDVTINAYRTSNKDVFDKGLHLFANKGILKKAMEDGYIIITDGVFDMLSLGAEGFNTAALLGSSLSEEHITYLKFIDKVYLAEDNDKAGSQLGRYMKKRLPNFARIKFTNFKDVDDILKSEHRKQFLEELKEGMSSPIITDIHIKFNKGKYTRIVRGES